MKVELITNEGRNWKVLLIDSLIYYERHSIPDFVWFKVIKMNTSNVVSEKEISDDDMENGRYWECQF